MLNCVYNTIKISIHTTARVVTPSMIVSISADTISIHTTARVVTKCIMCLAELQTISIHTTARVVTQFLYPILKSFRFQSTPPHGW